MTAHWLTICSPMVQMQKFLLCNKFSKKLGRWITYCKYSSSHQSKDQEFQNMWWSRIPLMWWCGGHLHQSNSMVSWTVHVTVEYFEHSHITPAGQQVGNAWVTRDIFMMQKMAANRTAKMKVGAWKYCVYPQFLGRYCWLKPNQHYLQSGVQMHDNIARIQQDHTILF